MDERTSQLREKQMELLRNNRLLKAEIRKRVRAEMIREEVERINRHDLKSGLSLVIGYPELLLREGGLNANQEKTLKRIRRITSYNVCYTKLLRDDQMHLFPVQEVVQAHEIDARHGRADLVAESGCPQDDLAITTAGTDLIEDSYNFV